ncbi:hypothetical protein ATCV1_z379R [Acanthocystis turfacea chlorella virus 1]|uniref:Uncharacterized protein z379R n=1 Tax=Chlorovirus heliozoae TaxID=322019 RepID=A7K8Y9_9PHYC|nr:hypothetical protein ATCV1_z379R [Acanthocystis turfacea chlorella virus 1]ABT16513.1 hypothetical protein ATCV1_z379R [Acanthocystis turfacea chlorella virus 1]
MILFTGLCFADFLLGGNRMSLPQMCFADFLLGDNTHLTTSSTSPQVVPTRNQRPIRINHQFLVIVQFFIRNVVPALLKCFPSVFLNST